VTAARLADAIASGVVFAIEDFDFSRGKLVIASNDRNENNHAIALPNGFMLDDPISSAGAVYRNLRPFK
jgi:hypothetical protein